MNRRDFLKLSAAGGAAGLLPTGLRAQNLPKGRPLGVALLGLGKYSQGELAPALQQTELCRLTGLISGHPQKAALWAAKYGVPARNVYTYDNLERIADNPEIDIVYVVTPPGVHAPFAIRAAQAGKHVISEKPLATTVADCDAMIAACRRAGVRFSVGYRLRFDPYHREMQRLARSQDFGVLRQMRGDRGFVFGQRAWRIDKRLAGGGPMMDLGIYIVHGACMAQNDLAPVAVTAHELPKKRPELFNEVEETMAFQLEFPNGARCDGIAGFNHRSDYFRAAGDRGWIEFREHAFTYKGIVAATSRGPLHYDPPFQQALQMDDFADCIATGRPTIASPELGRRDIRILNAVYEAAASGRRVAV